MGWNYYNWINLLVKGLILVFFLALFSCSQVKFVAEDDYLIDKVELEVDDPEINKEEAKTFVRQKENYKILGFIKFHLMLYNLSSKKKTDDWLKRIGEEPQIFDEVLSNRSVEQLKTFMEHKGFYRAKVNNTIELNEKKKKAKLKFQINTGEQ